MKILRHISRLIMGAVFVFSGFVKAIDPLGYTYKISDYFDAFGMDWLQVLSLVLAICISGAELIIGLALLYKIRIRIAAWVLAGFMAFFTVLTFIIALTNPVTDCGCFGDAIILTNWQTFFKNILFLVPTAVVFINRNKFKAMFTPVKEWLLTGVLSVFIILLSVYCLRNLPIIDFRPYHIGANIAEGMKIPEGMPVDEYETILVYAKDGMNQEFKLDSPEAPWNDSTWTWVETRNELIKKGYEPPIHDFTLVSGDGDDITEQILYDDDYSVMVVSYDINKANLEGFKKVVEFANRAINNGVNVYGMSASLENEIDHINSKLNIPFDFYTTDEITLKTMVRSNPGVLLVKEGTIIGKWHHRNVPDSAFFEAQLLGRATSLLEDKRNANMSLLVILIVGATGIIISYFRLTGRNIFG